MKQQESVPMSWRQQNVLDLLKDPEASLCQHLLRRYRPFNDSFLKTAGIDLPEIRHSIQEKVPLDFVPKSDDPIISSLVGSHIRLGYGIFIRVPFSAFVQNSLEIPSQHLENFSMEMGKFSFSVFDIMRKAEMVEEKCFDYRKSLVSWNNPSGLFFINLS